MIKLALTEPDGSKFIVLGLSRANLQNLTIDKPIMFHGQQVGIEPAVLILYGETEASIIKSLRRNEVIGPYAERKLRKLLK